MTKVVLICTYCVYPSVNFQQALSFDRLSIVQGDEVGNTYTPEGFVIVTTLDIHSKRTGTHFGA